jgi:hypothetical protein
MKKIGLVIVGVVVLSVGQTLSVNAQSVSSGMMSGQPKQQRTSEVVRPAQPKPVARGRAASDPVTTGSISTKRAN